ncbi:MAG TPA: MOSC domain-containing protein [Dehalococcoidia bacterium]
MARVVAVCTSQKKGTKKKEVDEALLQVNFGLVGDAHADSGTHRQVSLLAVESIAKMRDLGLEVKPGDFAENLTTEDIDLVSLPVGTRLSVGNQIVLEVTQIGKECHTRCAIYRQVGTCIMPVEGVFAKVIKGGPVSAGDSIKVV